METSTTSSPFIPITIRQVIQERSYSAVILQGKHKNFIIYMESIVGHFLQLYLDGEDPVRPSTYDLLNSIFMGLEMQVKQVVIHDLKDNIYFTALYLEQQQNGHRHIIEIDARPSDGLILAVTHKAPIYCTQAAFDKMIPIED